MKNSIYSSSENEDHELILKYFRLIDEKNMHSLLDVFTEDCSIYEPFSRNHCSSDNVGIGKTLLKGRSEIESFLNIVMMASDGLQYGVEFISEPFRHLKQSDSTASTASSSIVSALATFYRKDGEDRLKEKLTFHIVSKSSNDTCDLIAQNYEQNNKRKIETLCIQFCKPESFLHEPSKL